MRVPGRLAWAAALVAALVVALVVFAHTPPAARWGRDWLVRQVAAEWQLDLETSRLRVDLFARRLTLDDVRLSAPGHRDAPILTARTVSATLPWAVVRGVVRLSMLEVDDARVLLVREGGVLVNLPPPSGQPPPELARRLDLRGLRVRDLDVDYIDRTGDIEVAVSALSAALDERDIRIFTGASGTIAASGIRVRMGLHDTVSAAVEGRMAFDGSNISLQGLTVPLPEGRVVVDGRINRVLDDTRFALTLAGSLDYAVLAAWTPPPVPVSGTGTFEGTFEGPFGGYELRADFASDALRIGRASGLPLTGTVSVTPPRALIEPFTITAPASTGSPRTGIVEGRFTYEFGPGRSALAARWRDLDLDVALAAYEQAPLTFASWQEGSATLDRESPLAPRLLRASGVSRALVRADRVAIDGTWSARLENERWFARHDHRLLDAARAFGAVSWPAADEPARAVLSGPLTLEIADVGPVIDAARRSGINLPESLLGVSGPAAGGLTMGGSFATMIISGRVESSELVLPTGAPATAAADIVYDGDTLRASRFEIGTPGARVTGDVAMEMESGRLAGAFEADVSALQALAEPWTTATVLTGAMHASGTIGGTTDEPDVPFTVRSTPITVDGQHVGVVAMEARLLGTVIDVTRLVVDQAPGALTGSGRVDYLTGAYDVTLDGRELLWQNPADEAPVKAITLRFSFAGAGTFEEPGGSGTMTATPVGGSIGDFIGDADVRWRFAGGVMSATAFVPAMRTLVQATVEPRAPFAFRGSAVVNAVDVQPFALAIGALTDAVSGRVALSAAFDGTLSDPASAQAFVNLQQIDLFVGGLPVRLDGPARLTVRGDDVSVDDLSLRVGTSTLSVAGRFHEASEQSLRATYAGQLADVAALGRAFGLAPGVDMRGDIAATWESRGSLRQARSMVALSNASVGVADYPPIQALSVTAAFDGAVVTVDSLSATWQGGVIAGRARLPRALFETAAERPAGAPPPAGRVDVTLKGLTEQALAPWLPAATIAELGVRVSATLGLDVAALDLGGLRGTLVLDEAAVTAEGVPIVQERPARMSIAGRTLSFDDVAFSAGTPVVIGGTVTFEETAALDLRITGTPGLRPFSVLVPGITVDGAAVVDLRVTGTPAAPLVNGRVDLDAAEVVMREPRVIASDIAGPLLFADGRVSLATLKGALNGGTFEASGSVQITGVDVATGELLIQASGVAVEYPENVDSEIDALLVFAPGPAPVLRGDVRVLRGAYRATISLPALFAFNATAAAPAAAAPGYFDRVRLDVSVSTEDDLVIDNNYGRFEAGANVRLQGTGARPAVVGRAELREGGQVFMLGGLYRLNESSISFSNPNTIEPDLNISMITRTNGADVTLTLSGTVEHLQTSVTSSDPGADQSVLSVLLGGNTELDRESALALLSGELLGVTGRAIGLDSLRVERGFNTDDVRQDTSGIIEDADPTTRLTLSKRLRPEVEVVLSQDLRQSGAISAVVSYKPVRGVELRATSRDNTDRAYGVRHDISFGGAVPARSARRVLGDVSAVRFVGAPPEDEAALHALLRLTPGRPFDFIRWRDDAERLREWYRRRDRLEARVRASRTDEPDGRIALVYRVERGPRTELIVEGMPVSGRLRGQLESAWSDSVFDRFLVDEVTRTLQLDLVRRNLVAATVDVVVEATTSAKVIRATVREGEPAIARSIVYEGAAALSPAALDGAVAARALTDHAWVDPRVLVEPLQARYVEAGYRGATIVPGTPQVVDRRAVLVVTVEEGVRTTVTRATISGGIEVLRERTAAFVTALEGQPYRGADVDEVSQRIITAYRAQGYNNVEVSPSVALDPSGAEATLSFDVSAGREQRLAEVVVDGAGRTRPGAVVNALGLHTGSPVDLSQWALARKRLFDTNVFRQVDVRPEALPEPNADGTESVRARVTVTEWPTWRLRYGLQLDDRAEAAAGEDTSEGRRRDLGLVANLQNRNVFGRAFTFGLYGRVERRRQAANTYFTFPTLFGRAIQTNLFGSTSSADLFEDDNGDPTVRQRRSSISLEQRVRRGRSMEIVYGYRLTRDAQDAIDPEDPFYLAPVTGRFSSSAFFDRRDNPFNASRGWFASFTAERLSEFESNADSIKLLGTFYRYQPFGPVTLASAARIGGSFLDPLLFIEPFYAGGADSIRGFGENTVGPKNFLGFARGGNALLVLNQEVRGPIYRWLKGVVFVDAGNVFDANSELSLSRLEAGYGAGLRLDTPFSILRLDMARPVRGGTLRWYIGLGHIF